MSATIAWPPPNDISDSGANTRIRPIARLSSTAAPHQVKGEHAERNHDPDHRHHRKPQHADAAESDKSDEHRCPIAVQPRGNLDSHCESGCDAYGGGAKQDEMGR